MEGDNSFRGLYGEVQRLLGRALNTEELKILLGFVRYLGMTPDLVLIDVEEAMEAMGEVTGATVREDITARIFERFCVGK